MTVRVLPTEIREFSVYFDVIDDLCYCKDSKDVEGLFSAVGIYHDPTQWRLFIDSSTKSLKAVLLHNGNIPTCLFITHIYLSDERRL